MCRSPPRTGSGYSSASSANPAGHIGQVDSGCHDSDDGNFSVEVIIFILYQHSMFPDFTKILSPFFNTENFSNNSCKRKIVKDKYIVYCYNLFQKFH